jgi:DNA-binding transcriptional ArsR family regulator
LQHPNGQKAQVASSALVFAALGDPTRLQLVARLSGDGPLSIKRLQEGRAMSRQAITKHLESLAQAGLVRDTWQGRERLWQIEPQRLRQAQDYLARIGEQWEEALGRLKAFVEGE